MARVSLAVNIIGFVQSAMNNLLKQNHNKYIQRIAKSTVFLCFSLALIITQKNATFGNS
jgi:hypothetical protein